MLCVGVCINQGLLYRQEAGRNGIEILFLIDSVHRRGCHFEYNGRRRRGRARRVECICLLIVPEASGFRPSSPTDARLVNYLRSLQTPAHRSPSDRNSIIV